MGPYFTFKCYGLHITHRTYTHSLINSHTLYLVSALLFNLVPDLGLFLFELATRSEYAGNVLKLNAQVCEINGRFTASLMILTDNALELLS